jgi:hypothetical protein
LPVERDVNVPTLVINVCDAVCIAPVNFVAVKLLIPVTSFDALVVTTLFICAVPNVVISL